LDGELCVNLATETWEYLVYDVVAIQGDYRWGQKDYRSRMLAVEEWVVQPRILAASTAGSLRIRIKDIYEKTEIDLLFSRIYKNKDRDYVYENGDRLDGVVCNRNDGLIFTPVQLAYPLKSCPALLKWKYPLFNSVDFMLFIEVDGDKKEDDPRVRCLGVVFIFVVSAEDGICRIFIRIWDTKETVESYVIEKSSFLLV
jgi:hypothetical protein